MEEFITIGKIVNTHGVKGEVKIYPLTEDMSRFKKLQSVYIEGQQRNILGCKLQSKRVIFKIDGVDSIEDANRFRNKYIEVRREDAIRLDDGSYFVSDIIGCSIIDDCGKNYGKVSEVIHTPNNDVYWIKEGKELLVPALDEIVLNIDIEKSEIIIRPVKIWMSE